MSQEDYHAMGTGRSPPIMVAAAPTVIISDPVSHAPPYEPIPDYLMRGTSRQASFVNPLCAIGDIGSCLYSFLCPHCAMGSARNAMDGSDCMVTCFNMNPVLLRWTTRSAYHIPGSAWEDCVAGVLCPCCTINQVLQTTAQYGHPHGNVGPEHNYHMFHAVKDEECCNQCLYATFCLPCAIGTSLSQSMGMPFFLGCCCSNFCIARNLLRYHYRMKGDDCLEDCLAPYGIFFLTYFLSPFIPCLACCTYPYFVTMVMLMMNEARVRGNAGAYLTPTQSSNANAVVAAATVTMAEPPPIAVVFAPFPSNENMKLERGRNI